MESSEPCPEDFQGAAQGENVIYIASDESMECLSDASVDGLDDASEDEEVALLAQCVERQMEIPGTTELIRVPSDKNKSALNSAGLPGHLSLLGRCSTQDILISEMVEATSRGTPA